jgi:hypothetical protein
MLGACFLGIDKKLIAFDYAFGTLAISEGVLKILRLHNHLFLRQLMPTP